MKHRTLALAGLMQGLRLARAAAQDGRVDDADLAASLASVFRIDADSVEAVYGSASLMRTGLQTLIDQIHGGERRDPFISRMAVTVLQVERQFTNSSELVRRVQQGINEATRQREHFGITHPTVVGRLGDIYADTISQLPTRVLVQGNPVQLQQEAVVAQIRACLLASIRSATLWRQLRGSYWDWLFRRRAMLDAAEYWLNI